MDTIQLTENITMSKYSERSVVIRGDTRSVKDDMKKFGKWNPNLKGGKGWICSNNKVEEIKKFFNVSDNGSISVLDMCQNMGIQVMDLNDEDEDEDKDQQIKDLMNLVDMLKKENQELKIKLEKIEVKKVEEVEVEEVEVEVKEPKVGEKRHWILDVNFDSHNVKELRQICKRLGMKGYSKLTRSVLLDNLEAARAYAVNGAEGGYSYTGLSIVRK